MNIIIYDLSAMIISGAVSNISKDWNADGFPTGGIYKVLGFLLKDLQKNNTTIFVCKDSRVNFRKQQFPYYKANRQTKWSNIESTKIGLQFWLIDKILKEIGVTVLEQEGYEGDDLIYSVVNQYKNTASSITIRADDFDLLSTELIYPQVTIISPTGKGGNNNQLLRDPFVMYRKIIDGDVSDNVPSLKSYGLSDLALNKIRETFRTYQLEDQTNNIFLNMIEQGLLSQEGYNKILENIYLIVPKFISINTESVKSNEYIDKGRLAIFLQALYCKKYLKTYYHMEPDYSNREVINTNVEILKQLPQEVSDSFKDKLYSKDALRLNRLSS